MTYPFVPGSSYTWDRVPEACGWPRAHLSPAQLLREVPPSLPPKIPVPVEPYRVTNLQNQGDMHIQHVQMPYSLCLPSPTNAGYHHAVTATDPERHACLTTFRNDLGSVPGTADGFMNPANLAAAVDLVRPWAIDTRLGCNVAPYFRVPKMGDMPISANYWIGLSIPYIRRTRTGRRAPVSGPPQTFEGRPDVLATRLADEGADPDAVDLIRRVIFVTGVTEDALTAPIKSHELSLRHGGVRKKWQLLLQVTDMARGAKSYCCRLCPEERRPEYKKSADGLRHLKRDHFGISVACQYW